MIRFGTSGWRGVIADTFTLRGVKVVMQAIADYLKTEDCESKNVIVGYDTRFMSEDFAKCASEILVGNGFTVSFSEADVPTPVIAYEIIREKACGGINITASHNPAKYNGLKFSPPWGGPALPKTTKQIEKNCQKVDFEAIKKVEFNKAVKDGKIRVVSFKDAYLKELKRFVNVKAIKDSGIKIAVDVMHGAGRGYLDEFFKRHDIPYKAFHIDRNPFFGGGHPEPSEDRLGEVIQTIKSGKCDIGLATDGDADRFGIIDKNGAYISANQMLALLLYHLVKTRGWTGVVARSVMTSSFLDAVAKKYGIEVRETPVGFKYIGDILVNEDMIIGGEESGGLTIKGHIPEKDGVLACLLAAEMVAVSGKSLTETIQKLQNEVGYFYGVRDNYKISKQRMNKLKIKLEQNPPKEIGGRKVAKFITLDGYKFVFQNGDWMGIRFSGTEPIVRCYVETSSKEATEALSKAGGKLIKN